MTENEYTQNAIEAYVETLKRATRFELENVKVLQSKTTITKSRFFANYVFNTRYFNETIQGSVSRHSEDTIIYDDWNGFEKECQKVVDTEIGRKATYDEAIVRFSEVPFASLESKEILIRQNPNRVLHQYTCTDCHGHGEVTCGRCKGAKRITCKKCDGKRWYRCTSCNNGVVETQDILSGEKKYQRCGRCNGSTQVNCSCGDGTQWCDNCGGSGKVTCRTCGGKGVLTRIYELKTYATPEYTAEYLSGAPEFLQEIIENKVGLPSFVNYGKIELIKSDKSFEERSISLEYDAVLYVTELEIQIDDRKTKAILFGKDYTLFDSGGIVGQLLNEDLEEVEDLISEKTLFSKQYHKILQPPIAQFMESEVNQQMVDEINKNKDLNIVFENLGRLLSKEYLESANISLKILLSRLTNKVMIEGGVITAVVSVALLIFFYLFGFAQQEPYDLFGIPLIEKGCTWILYGLVMVAIAAELWYLKKLITSMGDKRLKIFSSNLAFGKSVFNGIALITLVTLFNYGSVQLGIDADRSSFESSQVEAPPVSSSNSDEQPVIETKSEPEAVPATVNAPKNENFQQDLIDACEKGKGHLCYQLGFSYQLDGDAENAKKYMQKACDAGFQDGCDGL